MKNKHPLIFQKNADKTRNRIIIPQFFINKYGRRFYMEINDDEIILRPVGKKEGK